MRSTKRVHRLVERELREVQNAVRDKYTWDSDFYLRNFNINMFDDISRPTMESLQSDGNAFVSGSSRRWSILGIDSSIEGESIEYSRNAR